MSKGRGAAAPSKDDVQRTERALRLIYGSILPRMNRGEARIGFARASYQLALVRNHAFFVQLAEELGEWWEQLIRDADASEEGSRRIERQHMEDAADDILDLVLKMPKPMQDVVARRASGMGWRQICAVLPDRAPFSMHDDWNAAVRHVWLERGDCVRRLI